MGYQETASPKIVKIFVQLNSFEILKWLMVCQSGWNYQSFIGFYTSWRCWYEKLHLPEDRKKPWKDSLVGEHEVVSKSCA